MARVPWKACGILAVLCLASLVPAAQAKTVPLHLTAWTVALNGHPEGAVVSGPGRITVDPSVRLDAPYAFAQPFPAQGDFEAAMTVELPSVAGRGAGLAIVDDRGRLLLRVWGDEAEGRYVQAYDSEASAVRSRHDLAPGNHTLTAALEGKRWTVAVDGEAFHEWSLAGRPKTLWVGHPSVGQLMGRNADGSAEPGTELDANGNVALRWWGTSPGAWTPIEVGGLSVTPAEGTRASPIPFTALLAVLAVTALSRRRDDGPAGSLA